MPIMSDAELNIILLRDFTNMIDELALKLLDKLEEYIQTEVYDAGTPNFYQRYGYNGGFLGSWTKTKTLAFLQTIKSSIYQDINQMVNYPDDFVHGSNYWGDITDIRDLLAEIIQLGKSGPLFGEGYWREPRDFWTPFIEMIDNGSADKIFEGIMTSHGIIWKKI